MIYLSASSEIVKSHLNNVRNKNYVPIFVVSRISILTAGDIAIHFSRMLQ